MSGKVGVLLVNLGTPDSPHPKDVKRYLKEFLTDGRVIDLPWLFRQLLVRGVIIPKRYKRSAKFYSVIWSQKGSPLKVHGHALASKLEEALGAKFSVKLAMRYQNPSIGVALKEFEAERPRHLVILPLFPQYSSATTGSVYQEVFRQIQKWEVIPSLSCIDEYATHPSLIDAFGSIATSYNFSDYDHILFSYHGLPERQILKADRCGHCLKQTDCCQTLGRQNQACYSAQCYATTRHLVKRLGLDEGSYSQSFQSRLGKSPWIRPYTGEVLKKLVQQGKRKVLVFCPAFSADCLETIHEIGVEYQSEFLEWGGEKLDLVEGLNSHPKWVEALQTIIEEQLPARLS